jgi:hypothetical protein
MTTSSRPFAQGSGERGAVSEFERSLPLVNEIVALLGEPRPGEVTTIAAIADGLHRSPNEIIRVFEILGIQPVSWEAPSDYRIEDILEAATRHEVSQRL